MIVAVDVGGTKTLVASFKDERRIIDEERFPTPQDTHEFLQELTATLRRFGAEHAEAICIAVPGLIDAQGTVMRCGNLPWVDFPLRRLLAQEYNCPIFIHNDAKLAGLAETNSLHEVPALSVYVTVSTGIGTGIIVNGRLDAALANSEGGHMLLQTPQGFEEWEKFSSGRAIRKQFGRRVADIHQDTDWHMIVNELALGFQVLIPLLQPNVIIIGGSVGSYFERFGPLLKEVLQHRLSSYIEVPLIRQAAHPQEAVVYGCYYYAIHQGTSTKA
jgi:predicted NBD/HSP70 family sugar kinase